MSDTQASWVELGVQETQFVKLLYNNASGKLIAQFCSIKEDGKAINTLYYRNENEKKYIKLTETDDQYSYLDVLTPYSRPFVITNKYKLQNGNGHYFADWVGVLQINLENKKVETVLSSNDLQRGKNVSDIWVSQLIDVSDNGEDITCSIAYQLEEMNSKSVVAYWLCNVNIKNKNITKITKLINTFL